MFNESNIIPYFKNRKIPNYKQLKQIHDYITDDATLIDQDDPIDSVREMEIMRETLLIPGWAIEYAWDKLNQ